MNAQSASSDEMLDVNVKPEVLFSDIVLAWRACALAVRQEDSSGNEGLLFSPDADEMETIRSQGHIFRSVQELTTRAIASCSLERLFSDKPQCGRSFAQSSVGHCELTTEIMVECVCRSFANGFYHDGLILASARSSILQDRRSDCDMFEDALVILFQTHLIPLATKLAVAQPGDRPSLRQLDSAQECFSSDHSSVATPTRLSGLKLAALYPDRIRSDADALLRMLIDRYAGEFSNKITTRTADCWLQSTGGREPLPVWLERLLIHGHGTGQEPGMFAKQSRSSVSPTAADRVFLGNGVDLLTLYTQRGMYLDACRIVQEILQGVSWDHRRGQASRRRPEKGDMDIVPYGQIDLLWNLLEQFLAVDRSDTANGNDDIIHAREEMEKAVLKHLELNRISEMGRTSAQTTRRAYS